MTIFLVLLISLDKNNELLKSSQVFLLNNFATHESRKTFIRFIYILFVFSSFLPFNVAIVH